MIEENFVKPVEKSFQEPEQKKGIDKILIGGIIASLVLGTITAVAINHFTGKSGQAGVGGSVGQATGEKGQQVKVGESYGSKDSVFKDSATGVVEANGIDGEGTHRLLREGGESQTAHLTSSVVDLDMFIGRKVEVWGETFDSEKAGWLLDVGRVKVIE